MGEVHRARAFGAAGVTKDLCIKRIRCERLADPASLSRFVAEARLSMRLSHANIVSVFDFGRSENDYYLAMEWVDGCDLKRLLSTMRGSGEPLGEDVAVFVASEIARALAYVHGRDVASDGAVTHCDLKPANVLVSRSGEVKLADFGVAVLDAMGAAGGTKRYMAPEQRRGEPVTAAVDLYALGLLLDELLGGERAAQEPTVPYVPPAASEPVRELLTHLLEVEPSRRPASTSAVADALEAALAEARVRTKRSPRDVLAARVSKAVGEREPSGELPETDFRTDASYLTEGESETFARRMSPSASHRSSSRDTPVPPAERPSPSSALRWPVLAGLVGVGALLGVLAIVAIESAHPSGVVGVPPHDAAATEAPRRTTPAVAPPAPQTEAPSIPSASPLDETRRDEPRRDETVRTDAVTPIPPPPSRAARTDARRAAPMPTTTRPTSTPTIVPPPPAPAAPAVLRINARPWAEVAIDGVAHGVTPLVGVELSPGPHDVVLTNPALGVSHTEHVDLADGEHRDVIVDLRP
jgi:serine/threonine protein kinase